MIEYFWYINLSAITDIIMAIRDHKENSLPDNYVHYLISIYETISVEDLNRTFSKLEDDTTYSRYFYNVATSPLIRKHQVVSRSLATYIPMDNTPQYCTIVFSLANKIYKELCHKGICNTAV